MKRTLLLHVAEPACISPEACELLHVSSYDLQPLPTEIEWTAPVLKIRWETLESVYVHTPWVVPGQSGWLLSTCTLRPRPEPYLLNLELARGTLHRTRTWLAEWQRAGVPVPEIVTRSLGDASRILGRASICQDRLSESALLADQSLQCTCDALRALGREYTRRMLADVHRYSPARRTSFGYDVQTWRRFTDPCRAATDNSVVAIPLDWSLIDREGEHDWHAVDQCFLGALPAARQIVSGPLIQLQPSVIPKDLSLTSHNLGLFLDRLERFVESAVTRYRGRIQAWHAVAGLNRSDMFGLQPDQRIQLAALIIEHVRRAAPHAEVFFSVEQPWGEYLKESPQAWSPLAFAEAIVRSRLGVTAIGLRISTDWGHDHCGRRDILHVLRLIDRWSALGLPLVILLNGSEHRDSQSGRPWLEGATGEDTRNLREWIAALSVPRAVMSVIWEGSETHPLSGSIHQAFQSLSRGELP